MRGTSWIYGGLACLFFLGAWPKGHARADMALPAMARKADGGEENWVGVAAARDAPVVAVWSADRLLVSEDGGRSFRERLEGRVPIEAAAVGEDGTVYVQRGNRLGVRRDRRDTWRTRSFRGFTSLLAAGAGKLVWIGHQNARPVDSENPSKPLVAVSADDGDSWTFQRPSTYQELYWNRAAVSPTGAISIASTFGDCRSWDAVMRGRVDGERWREDPWDSKPAVPPPLDARGREYRIEGNCLERAPRGSNQWERVGPFCR